MKTSKNLSLNQMLSALDTKIVHSPKDSVEQIVEWIANQTLFEFNVTSSEFNFLERSYHHYLVSFDDNGSARFGHGRDEDPYLAFLKAFSEAIERFAMSAFFKDRDDSAKPIQVKWSSDGKIEPSNFDVKFPPSARMHNSNGWAVHSELKKCLRNSLNEALERHSLQLMYWTSGLRELNPVKRLNFEGFDFELSKIPSGFGNLDTLTCSISSPGKPGKIFGHCTRAKATEEAWIHPMIEGYQIAKSLELADLTKPAEDIFDEIQRRFWEKGNFASPIRLLRPAENRSSLNLNITAFDLRKTLDLPFSLFATWIFSDELIPIYFEKNLTNEDRNTFGRQIKLLTDQEIELVQTPFI